MGRKKGKSYWRGIKKDVNIIRLRVVFGGVIVIAMLISGMVYDSQAFGVLDLGDNIFNVENPFIYSKERIKKRNRKFSGVLKQFSKFKVFPETDHSMSFGGGSKRSAIGGNSFTGGTIFSLGATAAVSGGGLASISPYLRGEGDDGSQEEDEKFEEELVLLKDICGIDCDEENSNREGRKADDGEGQDYDEDTLVNNAAPVPEPSSVILLGSGLLGFVLRKFKK